LDKLLEGFKTGFAMTLKKPGRTVGLHIAENVKRKFTIAFKK
jgi:hypothetical protein